MNFASTKQHVMAATLKLNCWVLGDDASQVFPIHIANIESVGTLKKVIKHEISESFPNIDARSITLRKVSIPKDRLQQSLANLDITGETSLSSMDDLDDVFSDEPPRKHLHIVVKPPDGE
jgi:Crinkler effector protein N-terminal domain